MRWHIQSNEQWLEQQINGPVGLVDFIETFVADFLANRMPIPITEDPLPLLEDTTHPHPLIPIMVPIASLAAIVNSHEMVLEGSLG